MQRTTNKMSEALTQINTENQARDRKFAEAFSQMNAENRVRERRVEEKFTNQEKRVDAKIEEKFSALEMKIDAVEKRSTEINGRTWDARGMNEKLRSIPKENNTVATDRIQRRL